jgi:mono/diheme cytochrome c family protein
LSLTLVAQQPPATAPPSSPDVPRFGIVEYPQRTPGDPAAIERGRTLYGVSCRFCHGADLRGGDGGGPNLLRSTTVLDDIQGERIGPIVRGGRGAMPPLALTDAQLGDLAAYLHSFPVTSRLLPSTVNIVVGDAKTGERYVAETCGACHTTAALATFARTPTLSDPKVLQQMWLMPGFAGRGAPPIPAPVLRAAVTPASGGRVEGALVRMDDFTVSLELADGSHRTFKTAGTKTTVEILDPLAPHKALLRAYRDADIHNVTAYLVSLRNQP